MNKSFLKILLLLVMNTVLVLFTSQYAAAATLTVTNTTDTDDGACNSDCSLREAVLYAAAGDTINFSPSVTGRIELPNGQIIVEKNLNINGPGAKVLAVVNTFERDRVFFVNAGVTATISGLTILNEVRANDFGGGIYNEGTLVVSNIRISNINSIDGGGIFNPGVMTIFNSTISHNAAYGGAGISNGGTLTVVNSTISNNNALLPGGGISNSGTTTLINSTIAGNRANTGGGIDNLSGTVNSRNSIIAENTSKTITGSGPDFFGTLTSQGYNLIGNTSGMTGAIATDIINPNPLLGPLADNGGPTATHALLPGSPAINAGSNALAVDASNQALTTDQRGAGYSRISPNSGTVDIGAFELQIDNTPPTCTATASSNTLWSPNHKLVDITTSVIVNDDGPGPNSFKLLSVTSSEADTGLGTDDVPNDIQGWVTGTADTAGQLRSERFAMAGRNYIITYQASDLAGNTGNCSTTVKVPHDQGKK